MASGSPAICGVVLESQLAEGRQDLEAGRPLTYGQDITDACIAWETTVPILQQLPTAVRQRRVEQAARGIGAGFAAPAARTLAARLRTSPAVRSPQVGRAAKPLLQPT